MEHCLIGTENLFVFEMSVDPNGMDQDLVCIYEPRGQSHVYVGAESWQATEIRHTVKASVSARP
jgi:PHD/YefM family antitoxin component YafN of YafNO toxin-antitoxin module